MGVFSFCINKPYSIYIRSKFNKTWTGERLRQVVLSGERYSQMGLACLHGNPGRSRISFPFFSAKKATKKATSGSGQSRWRVQDVSLSLSLSFLYFSCSSFFFTLILCDDNQLPSQSNRSTLVPKQTEYRIHTYSTLRTLSLSWFLLWTHESKNEGTSTPRSMPSVCLPTTWIFYYLRLHEVSVHKSQKPGRSLQISI